MNANDKLPESIPEEPISALQNTWWHLKNGFYTKHQGDGDRGADGIIEFFKLLGDPNIEPKKLQEAFALQIRESEKSLMFSGRRGFSPSYFLDFYDQGLYGVEALRTLGYEDLAHELSLMRERLKAVCEAYEEYRDEEGDVQKITDELRELRQKCSHLFTEDELLHIEKNVKTD